MILNDEEEIYSHFCQDGLDDPIKVDVKHMWTNVNVQVVETVDTTTDSKCNPSADYRRSGQSWNIHGTIQISDIIFL